MSCCKNDLDIDFQNEWNKESVRPSFNARKSGFITEMKRPVYVPKTINQVSSDSLDKFKNKRTGTGNYDLKRLNFMAVPIHGRNVIDFEKLQLQEQAQQGIKVQLGDKTIRDLFQVQVPDSSDREWLRIYNERKANGISDEYQKISPPLGRPQRTVVKMVNPGQQLLNFDEKLKLLLAQSQAGAVENVNDLATITAKLTALCEDVDALSGVSQAQADVLRNVLRRVNLPTTFDVFFYNTNQTRIVSLNQFKSNIGQITLFLLNRASNTQRPVIGVSGTPITLLSMVTLMTQNQFLYLGSNIPKMITRKQAEDLVSEGMDNGLLDGSPIPIDLPLP